MSAIDDVLAARTPQELFPGDEAAVAAKFKKLQRQVHPDLHPDNLAQATEAFVKLTEFHTKLGAAEEFTTITTRKGIYSVGRDVWRSSGVRYKALEETEQTWLAYVASMGATGPFVEGHRNLATLNRELEDLDADNGTTHRYFIPRVIDQFKLGSAKAEARVLSAQAPGTRWFPLSQWTSMDPRDIGWISRRVLIALDLIHKQEYLHGSPHLEAIIIEPEKHGVMLKDWQYSVRMGDPLQLIDPAAKSAYPSWSKTPQATATGKLDLIIVGAAFERLARMSAAPPWLQEFFQKLQSDPPEQAAYALEKLTALLDSHWKRSFHPMAYPA